MANKDDYQDFKTALNDLKMNSKPIINFLTILAEEKMHSAPQIVRAIEERIVETKGDQVLPALYVLDSIVKNLRSSIYVQLFESRLPVLFANAFNRVDERTRSSMFKLRQTWSPFFTNLTLYNLDTRTHDIDPAWPITARVPDPPPLTPNIHLNPNFLQRNTSSSDQQPTITDEVRQQILHPQQDDSEASVFRTRTVNQPPISLAPPKLSELTTRSDTYHMIPIDRMEQIRHETAHVLDLGVDGEQQSKIKKNLVGKKKKTNKKRRPSARLRRRAMALAQSVTNNDQDTSDGDDNTDNEGNQDNNGDDNDDDEDDEPFIIKKSIAINNGLRIKPTDLNTNNGNMNDVEVLFGGTDKDYREADVTTTQSTNANNSIILDADSIFEINSKCLSLAEQKYKAKELSFEEYQATLKLLQQILESEVKRLTVQQTNASSSLLNGTNHSSLTSQTTSLPTPPTHPFQQQLLQFTQQHAPQTMSTFSNPSFPLPGFGPDAHRHVMQILATVGAPSSYTSNYNFLPYLPPLPPAPPSFTLIQNAFQSQQTASTSPDQQIYSGRQSPTSKRSYDETDYINNNTDEDNKRPRYDPVTGRATRPRNFDEENVAPVPSLIDANLNMLKKKYVGIVQQLFIGKFQCRLCGLRFTAKQKHHYTHHLDWHYLENKQEKDLNTTTTPTSLLQRTRPWYSTVQEWTIYEENLEEQIRTGKLPSTQIRPIKDNNNILIQGENILSSTGVISCPATGNDDDRCYVCHDPFENFFDDNREEWHLKDAIRVDGKTYHPICYQDVQYEATNEKVPVTDLLSTNDSSTSSKLLTDETNHLSSNTTTTVDSSTTDKIDNDNTVIENLSTNNNNSIETNYPSALSLVDLVETIFVKREDIKITETTEQISVNSTTTSISEEIPLLSTIEQKLDSESSITNNQFEEMGTTSD